MKSYPSGSELLCVILSFAFSQGSDPVPEKYLSLQKHNTTFRKSDIVRGFSIAGREELESYTGQAVDQLTSLIKQLVFRARNQIP